MDRDWVRLADYLRAEMDRHGWTSQAEFATAASVGTRLIGELLSGHGFKRMPYKIARVERAIGWAPGTARRILEGGTPEQPVPEPKSDDDWVEDVMAQIESLPRHAKLRALARLNLAILEADEKRSHNRSDDEE